MLPFLFFAVHGNFSFQQGVSGGSSLAALIPTRNLGVFGYVIVPGVAYAVVTWLITINVNGVLQIAMQMKALTLLAVLTICSALWSQDPVRSSYNGVFYLVGTLFAFYLVLRFKPEEIMTIVQMLGAVVCGLGLFLIILLPKFGLARDPRYSDAWQGIFIDRTSAAKCLVFLLSPALVFRYRRSGYLRMAYIVLLVTFIVMAHAITAAIAVCIYCLFMAMLFCSRRLERKTAYVLGIFAVVGCIVLVIAALPYAADVLRLFGRDLTLTGRTELWVAVTRSILKRPVLGYGFYAFWLGLKGESAHAIIAAHWMYGYAHNGILDLLLQLGLVGLALFVVTLSQAIRDLWTCIGHECSIGVDWYIGLIVLTVLYNIDENTLLLPNELLSILYVVACCGLARAARHIKEGGPLGGSHTDAGNISFT
jgi:O-antigen ligase